MDWVKKHNYLASVGSGRHGHGYRLGCGPPSVKSGWLTLGDFLLLMAYMSQLAAPLDTATKKLGNLQSCFVGFRRTLAILDIPPLLTDPAAPRTLQRARRKVAFRGISLAYPGASPVLRDISFSIPAGTRVGILGSSGGGKSTLVNLIARFIDPLEGTVLLNSVNVRQYRLTDFRKQFCLTTHRPSTLTSCEIQLVLNQGRVSLLALDGDHIQTTGHSAPCGFGGSQRSSYRRVLESGAAWPR